MNITQIETNLIKLVEAIDKETFIYDLLLAYNLPKSSITRLQKGNLNLSKRESEISWKKKLLFREVYDQDLHLAITELTKEAKHDQRFIIVTDYKALLAIDIKTQDKLDIKLDELNKHYAFFLPWAGMEKAQHKNENPADVKAAEKMAKLFDEIKKDNPDTSPEFIHGLNVFLSRLLFCFFAEDTDIFDDSLFTNSISSHTQADGGDLGEYLDRLFEVLNTDKKDRKDIPAHLMEFPYVHGGLFRQKIQCPIFTRRSRQAIIESGELQWSEINPDIFGSMIQAVITPEHRGGLGMHYTSVPNIMKVIEPLFLNDLYEDFEKAKGNKKKLSELLNRIAKIKIFDPACGSGNFLIIAYKELRRLEMKIFKEGGLMALSGISLSQFYGIELDDFAHEIAQLSLWLAEHQMNVEFFREFGRTNPTLPLKQAGRIVHGNACRLDWDNVCPKKDDDEIFILGNPPYLGARMQGLDQKNDMDHVFSSDLKKYRDLDYIACWFFKGAKYIRDYNARLAFVTTNSINQGQQVALFWPSIFNYGLEINFAHTSFQWKNNAKSNAAVVVAIIGIANKNQNHKKIFSQGISKTVNSINAYLSDGASVIIQTRSKPLSFYLEAYKGNQATDGGGLILSEKERDWFIENHPECSVFVKSLIGSQELIKGISRFCLWLEEKDKEEFSKYPFILKRLEVTRQSRLSSPDKATQELANHSYRFRDCHQTKTTSIVIPGVSSENRRYVPIGFYGPDTIVTNSAFVIYDADAWMFGTLTSKMHMLWLENVGGKLETRYRYAKDLVYNTFPFPSVSNQRKEEITQCVFRILEEREKHSEKSLAQMYDPDKMPDGLREAHRLNDEAIERCYRSRPFESDEERLEYLFKLYEKMIEEEKEKNTLFEKQKKTRKQ